jgi:hypothetical protein
MRVAFSGVHPPNLLARIGCGFHFQHIADPLHAANGTAGNPSVSELARGDGFSGQTPCDRPIAEFRSRRSGEVQGTLSEIVVTASSLIPTVYLTEQIRGQVRRSNPQCCS